jgi:hypothetical protein
VFVTAASRGRLAVRFLRLFIRFVPSLACVLVALHSHAALIASFQGGGANWHMGTIGVGNLLGTPDLVIVVPYRDSSGNWFIDAFKYNGQRLAGFPYSSGPEVMNVSPTLYDLDRDGKDEIIFTRGNHVIALRGNGSVMWSNTVNSANYIPNGGYQTETNGFHWSADGSFIHTLPSSAIFYSEVSSPMVIDLNGRGTNEIITGWKIDPDPNGTAQDYNPYINDIWGFGEWGTIGEDWSGGVVTFNATNGQQSFVYHLHHLLEAGLAVGRADAGQPLNIYALNDGDNVAAFDKSKPFGLWGKGMLHKSFGKAQQLACGSYKIPIDVFTADLDGDGLDEALVSTTQLSTLIKPSETILDDDGMVLWRRWLPRVDYVNNNGWLNSSAMIPVNPDHDNHADVLSFQHAYEISFRYWNGVELVDRPGWPKNFYPLLPTPPVVGDVDGDGQEEIIIGTYDPTAAPSTGSLLIYALDGTLKQNIAVPGGIKQIPALADVRGLGRTDVIYRSLNGMIYVQNFGSTSTNLVSWSTHRGNMHRDGNAGRSLFPPGTPLVTKKTSGYNRTSFTWTNSSSAQLYRIFRAEQGEGPFLQIATVLPTTTTYTDYNLKPGWQYFYEVRAVYNTGTVASSPFAVLSLLNSNLIANAGFEENDNSHWDKWFTGSIDATNMFAGTNTAFQGKQSMRVVLANQGNNGTIAQSDQYGIPDACLYTTPGAFYSYGGYFKSGGISQPSEHWFTWGSTKTGYDTNNRPALPYPWYFTPHFVAGTSPTGWTYVNRTFQLPAGFPNVELWHNYSIAAPGSGSLYMDNVFFRQIPAPNATNWTALIPFGATWRYYTGTPPGNWFAPSFNDASWPSAPAKFGAGSGPTNIITRVAQLKPAYYFRKQFTLNSADVEELLLSATCTDDPGNSLHLFINGVEIQSTIDTVTAQGNEARYFDLTPFASLLQPGNNTVAVQLNNSWADWDDVAFDLSLKAVTYHPTKPRLSVSFPTPLTPRISVETPAGTIWQLQSSDTFPPTSWQPMQTVTNLLGGIQTFLDTGQNGRLVPSVAKSRYYRLVPF